MPFSEEEIPLSLCHFNESLRLLIQSFLEIEKNEDKVPSVRLSFYAYDFSLLNAYSTAFNVTAMSSFVWAVVKNQASYLDGARLMP